MLLCASVSDELKLCCISPCVMQGAVEDQIYPQIATGFLDSNAYLRELTLKSMLVLAPKLTQRTLNQSLLKSLAKLQVGWMSAG